MMINTRMKNIADKFGYKMVNYNYFPYWGFDDVKTTLWQYGMKILISYNLI